MATQTLNANLKAQLEKCLGEVYNLQHTKTPNYFITCKSSGGKNNFVGILFADKTIVVTYLNDNMKPATVNNYGWPVGKITAMTANQAAALIKAAY